MKPMENGIPRVVAGGSAGLAAARTNNSPGQTERKVGMLLVGHGTRSEQGKEEFLRVAGLVAAAAAPIPVEPAFLEFCQPTIRQAVGRLVEQGTQSIVVVPLLLFAAGHAKDDVPAAVAESLSKFGVATDVTVAMAPHLGCHPAIVELSARRYAEAAKHYDAVPASQTCLVLIGRGSHDESAMAEMHEFARLRAAMTPAAEVHVAFLAMAQPSWSDVLALVSAGNWRRIVVQPHLLFHGDLYERLVAGVADLARIATGSQWIVTEYLAGHGDEASIATTVLARAVAAVPIRVVAPGSDR